LNKNLLAFLASTIFSMGTVILIRRLNLPVFLTFSVAIYASYTLIIIVIILNYMAKLRKIK
jgi:hypothetical protein